MKWPQDRTLFGRARELRKHSTLAEVLLWKHLNGTQRQGFDFHRQQVIARYIVDFFAPELALVVEVDGVSHDFRAEADVGRDAELRGLGLTVLRFGDREVKRDALGVAQQIDAWIAARESHTPAPSRHPSC